MESFKELLFLCTLLFLFIPKSNTLDTIGVGQSVKDAETLVSASETFEAGFFSLGGSNYSQYFGIWYKGLSPKTIVWVANRDSPLRDSSGLLNFTDGGNLLILDSKGNVFWSSNSSTNSKNPVLQLLDSGNLVVKERNSQKILWESFDLPGDTLLPGMKIRTDIVSGNFTSMTSWKDMQDPATGFYSHHIDPNGYPQVVVTGRGKILLRLGSWNGNILSGIPSETLYKSFNFSFVFDENEVSYGFELLDKSIVSQYMITSTGQVQRFIWSDQTDSWELFLAGPGDQCDNYAICGPNSNCDAGNTPTCGCLQGFIPKSQKKWSSQIWSDGCVRRVNLSCDNSDGFLKYPRMKLPDTSRSWYDKNMSLKECEKFCLKNCSCTAYASLDIRNGGSGCLLWFNNIVDVRKLTSGGQDLYVRVAASELGDKDGLDKNKIAGIVVGCSVFIIVLIILGIAIWIKRFKKQGKNQIVNLKNHTDNNDKEEIDTPMYDFSTLAIATDHFAVNNKLGEGGFGPVYKGTLTNGQDIAVKRLHEKSGQGPNEFINEVSLIANLQHRNLVKLIGCCIHSDERLLIYEFMPNRSLDYFLFDHTRKSLLQWRQRFQIICGIARGLLYLHEDSRLRIIHRDLKTSNILLDKNMNPKISDFGLARTFVGDQEESKTQRIVGTYGYISPEYAARGNFSVKSDVFSFGVILLEIISGRKNSEFFDDNDLDLMGHAWRLWCEERPLKLVDESLIDSSPLPESEVLRCIHIGLLCVQERPEDRPDMSAIVLMLNGEKSLPRPREPAFYPHQLGSSSVNFALTSTNEVSITLLDAR